MKIQLTYDRPAQINTDLLVIILDPEIKFHDLTGSPLDEVVRRVARDVSEKRRKREYLTSMGGPGGEQNVVVFSTALNPGYNIWENLKIFVARSLRLAKEQSLNRICIVLNTDDAAPFVGKAVEGAILGGYTFDRYKAQKEDLNNMQLTIAALKSHEQQNRHYVDRYSLVSNAIN